MRGDIFINAVTRVGPNVKCAFLKLSMHHVELNSGRDIRENFILLFQIRGDDQPD